MSYILNIKTIEAHQKGIPKVSIFPSGNIISISNDLSIKIWDNNFNLIQHIENAHEEYLTYVEIENENNFVTCSDDRSIKFWNKQYNIFTLKENIINAHQSGITKVIFIKNKQNLISCSEDETIKVWEKKNKINKYQCVNIIQLPGWVFSIMDIPDKNLLLVAGPFLGVFFTIIFILILILLLIMLIVELIIVFKELIMRELLLEEEKIVLLKF